MRTAGQACGCCGWRRCRTGPHRGPACPRSSGHAPSPSRGRGRTAVAEAVGADPVPRRSARPHGQPASGPRGAARGRRDSVCRVAGRAHRAHQHHARRDPGAALEGTERALRRGGSGDPADRRTRDHSCRISGGRPTGTGVDTPYPPPHRAGLPPRRCHPEGTNRLSHRDTPTRPTRLPPPRRTATSQRDHPSSRSATTLSREHAPGSTVGESRPVLAADRRPIRRRGLMSFDTPHGTRGARQPGGKLMAWMNTWNMNRIRGNADKVMGMQALVLTTVGAKSGTLRHTPVAYFPDGADGWLIVASANGAAKNPAWYYNLAGHPDTVQIQIAGRTIAVNAEQLHGNARQQAWRHITSTAKRFAKYEQKTDRELPVIRLRTRPNQSSRSSAPTPQQAPG